MRFYCAIYTERQTAKAKARKRESKRGKIFLSQLIASRRVATDIVGLIVSTLDLPTIPSTWEIVRSIWRSIRSVPALRERALWITHIWEFRQVVFPSTVGGDAKSSAWAKIGRGLPIPRVWVVLLCMPT